MAKREKLIVIEVDTAAKLRGKGLKVKAPRMCYFVDAMAWSEEAQGYRVSIVIEGEEGHRPTGDDDWATNPRARRPYFWGPTLENAEWACEEQNKKMGISKEDAFKIVMDSMFPKRMMRVMGKRKRNR